MPLTFAFSGSKRSVVSGGGVGAGDGFVTQVSSGPHAAVNSGDAVDSAKNLACKIIHLIRCVAYELQPKHSRW